jgi:hypothetical protein
LTGQNSLGKNTGLPRKKHRTPQEEIPDSPGRNTGLSRKKHRTLQEETPDSSGRNTGLLRKYVLQFSCKLQDFANDVRVPLFVYCYIVVH